MEGHDDFQQVYSAYYGDIHDLIETLIDDSETTDMLTEETFVNAYRSWHRYRERRAIPLSEWLSAIAVNNATNYKKRN